MVDEHPDDPERPSESDDESAERSGDHTAKKGGAMLARTWTIAVNFRKPADYGIPAAPTFCGERRPDGTLVLFACPETRESVMTAERSMTVRR